MDSLTFREIFPAVIALIGVVLGAFLAELQTLLQGARGRRRALRFLLYHLLELRHQIRTRDPGEFLPFIISYITSRAGPEAAEKFNAAEIQRQLRDVMKIVTSITSSKPFALEYQKAVEALAPYDPILAYRLTGQEGVLDLDRELRLYYEQVAALPDIKLDKSQRGFIEQAQSATLKAAYHLALDEMSKKIRLVAKKISFFIWYRANSHLKYQDKLSSDKLRNEMTKFLDKWFSDLASDANAMIV